MEPSIRKAYRNARTRLLLLDYDGTLADITRLPHQAKPSAEIVAMLQKLAEDPANTVVTVSGRNHADLEEWLGGLPLFFAAEHGLLYKEPGGQWHAATGTNDSWKAAVRHTMEQYVAAADGTFIEEKTNGLVWHYRTAASQKKAQIAEKKLFRDLQPLGRNLKLRITRGAKIIEAQPDGVHKGIGAKRWLDNKEWDFILSAGDDITDEDMFRVMPPGAFTVKVGPGNTIARFRLDTPGDMRKLLHTLL